MPDLQAALKMNTNMTSVMDKVLKSMENTMRVFDRMDKMAKNDSFYEAFNHAKAGIFEARQELDKFHDDVQKSQKRLDNLANFKFGGSSKWAMITTGVNQALSLAERGVAHINNLMNKNDMVISTNARLNLVNDGTMSKDSWEDYVRQTAIDSRASYGSTATLIQRLNMGEVSSLQSSKDKADFAETVNKALVTGGSTATERDSAVLQLSQALASGKLQGDEFKSMSESSPKLMSYIAEGMGKPRGELKKLATDGQLTSEVIVNALTGMTDKVNEEFAKMPITFGDNAQMMQDKLSQRLNDNSGVFDVINERMSEFTHWMDTADGQVFFQQLATGAGEAINVLSGAGQAIGWLATNGLPVLKGGILGVGIAWGSYKLAQFGANTMTMIGSGITTAATLKEYGFSTAVQVASASTFAEKQAIIENAVAKGVNTAATTSETVAKTINTGATKAAEKAQWGLNAAMSANPVMAVISVLGTLAGVITGVATAYGSMANQANNAAQANLNVAMSSTYVNGHKISELPFEKEFARIKEIEDDINDAEKRAGSKKNLDRNGHRKFISNYVDNASNSDLEKYFNAAEADYYKRIQKYRESNKTGRGYGGGGSWDKLNVNTKYELTRKYLKENPTENNLYSDAVKEQDITRKKIEDYADWIDNKANKSEIEVVKKTIMDLASNDEKIHAENILSRFGKNVSDMTGQENTLELALNRFEIEDMQSKFKNIEGSTKAIDENTRKVDISEESFQYLVDSMERRYINQINVNSPAPTTTIAFNGDIRESADVNSIIERAGQITYEELQRSRDFVSAS